MSKRGEAHLRRLARERKLGAVEQGAYLAEAARRGDPRAIAELWADKIMAMPVEYNFMWDDGRGASGHEDVCPWPPKVNRARDLEAAEFGAFLATLETSLKHERGVNLAVNEIASPLIVIPKRKKKARITARLGVSDDLSHGALLLIGVARRSFVLSGADYVFGLRSFPKLTTFGRWQGTNLLLQEERDQWLENAARYLEDNTDLAFCVTALWGSFPEDEEGCPGILDWWESERDVTRADNWLTARVEQLRQLFLADLYVWDLLTIN